MSNRVSLERREVKRVKTGVVSKEAYLFDDYACDSITFEHNFPDSDLDLFKDVIIAQKTDFNFPQIEEILDSLYESEKGIDIDDTFYEWKEIKPILEEYWIKEEAT